MQIIITILIVLISFYFLIRRIKRSFRTTKDCNCDAVSCSGCPYASMQKQNEK